MKKIDRTSSGEDALRDVRPKAWPAPAREELLAQAYLRAENTIENQMTVFDRLFAGRPLAAKAAIVAGLLGVLIIAAIMLPRELNFGVGGPEFSYPIAQASENHLLLIYKVPYSRLDEYFQELKQVGASFTVPDETEVRINRERFLVKTQQVSGDDVAHRDRQESIGSLMITMVGGNLALFEDLKARVAAEIPELPAGEVHQTSTFRETREKLQGFHVPIVIDGKKESFIFPFSANEEYVRTAINLWLKRRKPEREYEIEVQVRTGEHFKTIVVRVEPVGEPANAEQ